MFFLVGGDTSHQWSGISHQGTEDRLALWAHGMRPDAISRPPSSGRTLCAHGTGPVTINTTGAALALWAHDMRPYGGGAAGGGASGSGAAGAALRGVALRGSGAAGGGPFSFGIPYFLFFRIFFSFGFSYLSDYLFWFFFSIGLPFLSDSLFFRISFSFGKTSF